MKKSILLLISVLTLVSCGKEKKEEVVSLEKDNYSVFFDAIYEKDDEISMIFKIDGFWDYDHPKTFKIQGNTAMQNLTFELPKGLAVENVQIDLSSNIEQKTLTLKGVSISNNEKIIISGSEMGFVQYFNTGTGLDWDYVKLRYNLIFGGEFPPRMVGNELLESMLVK
jgi:hypothetical protein